MTEKFIAEPDPSRKGGGLVVRVDTNGERFVTPRLFRKQATANAWAYQLQVKSERRRNRVPYLAQLAQIRGCGIGKSKP